MEVSQTVRRLQSGREAYIRKNGEDAKIGRPTGSTLSVKDLLAKHTDVVRLLKKGMSIRNTAKLCDKGVSTVQRVKQHLTA